MNLCCSKSDLPQDQSLWRKTRFLLNLVKTKNHNFFCQDFSRWVFNNIPTNLWNLALLTGSVICDPRMLFQIMTSIMILKNKVHKRIGEARMIITPLSRIKWPQNRSHYWVSKQNQQVSSMLAFNSRYDELHEQMGKFLIVQNFRN